MDKVDKMKIADKIDKLKIVETVLYKHFAHAIDKVVQQAIKDAAAELVTLIPPEYFEQLARKKDNEQNTPRGVKIDIDKVDMDDREYTFIITDWIAEKKGLPAQFVTQEVEDMTTKAILVKFQGKEIWIPKSQVLAVYALEVEQ